MTYSQNDATERWNRNSAAWHRVFGENDPSRKYLLDPIIFRILADVSGKRVLDAGCGDGYLSRKFARMGAKVTGVELSPEMLSYALEEQKHEPLDIAYHHASITSMTFLAERSFDVAVTNNVIQDVEDYQGALKEFSRLLRPGGTYLHIENHPCIATPVCGWERDADGNRLYWKIDHYFKRGPSLIGWRPETGMEPTVSWHRTLGDLVNSLIACGFRLTELIEPEPPESWRTTRPVAYDADMRKPDFIILVCKREDEFK